MDDFDWIPHSHVRVSRFQALNFGLSNHHSNRNTKGQTLRGARLSSSSRSRIDCILMAGSSSSSSSRRGTGSSGGGSRQLALGCCVGLMVSMAVSLVQAEDWFGGRRQRWLS